MVSAFIACEPLGEDALVERMWEAGTTGIVEEAGGLRVFFETEAELLKAMGSDPHPWRREAETDWARQSLDSFPCVSIGKRFFLAPEWSTEATPPGRIRLTTNPGIACGTGYHECTQMCIEALEEYLRPGDSMLDVGCGSGILLRAARHLGAAVTVGCDIDFEAIQGNPLPLFAGSAGAVRSQSFQIVVANISTVSVEELAPELERIRVAGGRLILSGFIESEIVEGFQPIRRLQKGEWVCLIV